MDWGEVPERTPKENTLKEDTLKDSSSRRATTEEQSKGEPEGLAAADIGLNSNQNRATQRQADTRPCCIQKPIADAERQYLLAELAKRGLPEGIAQSCLEAVADPALTREIIGYFDSELPTGRFDDPLAVLRSMLKHPQDKWGFQRTESGWQQPSPGRRSQIGKTLKEMEAEVQAERQARGRRDREDLASGGMARLAEGIRTEKRGIHVQCT
jgi:hypothetical protein